MRSPLFALLAPILLAAALLPSTTAAPRADVVRSYDAEGRLVLEVGVEPRDGRLDYARTITYARATSTPDLTDCVSDAYRLAGWRWTAPYSVATTAHAAEVARALATWDAATGASLAGAVAQGAAGTAGVFDGANQIDWVDLGSTSTIAVTTTWYSRSTRIAVESDGQYNTRFAWSTVGAAGAMDVENIVAHEVGHTFGLAHPATSKANACLTMYAYGALGETQKRTLGDGDILGVRKAYGG